MSRRRDRIRRQMQRHIDADGQRDRQEALDRERLEADMAKKPPEQQVADLLQYWKDQARKRGHR